MRKITFLLGFAALLMIGACSDYKKGKAGLRYRILKDEHGPEIGKVAVVFVSYTEETENGTILGQTGTFDQRPAEVYATHPDFEGDLQDAFPYLSEGDSAIVKVNLDSIKRRNNVPLLSSDSSKYMIYTLKINKVINQEGKMDAGFLQRVEAYKRAQWLERKSTEPEKIRRYLTAKKLNYKTTPSGLRYPADLKLANHTGTKISVRYTISSLDGKVYEASYKNIFSNTETAALQKNDQGPKMTRELRNFAGFKEALAMIPKGVKTKVIIPSNLAYGAIGNNTDMRPYTPLLVEFEILDK